MNNRQCCQVGLLAVAIEARRMERYIIGLPLRRRSAHIHQRFPNPVYTAALIVQAFETVTVECLYLISPLKVDTAVATSLSARVGPKWSAEFEVKLAVTEFLPCNDGVSHCKISHQWCQCNLWRY